MGPKRTSLREIADAKRRASTPADASDGGNGGLELSSARLHRRKRLFLVGVAIAFSVAIIIVAVCPITTLETPRWDVWVVDEKGQPLAGMTVRIVYRNY